MIRTNKARYYKDKDGKLRTIHCYRLMAKKDILRIQNLYLNGGIAKSMLEKEKEVRYSYKRIKKLINKLEEIRLLNGEFPENYLD